MPAKSRKSNTKQIGWPLAPLENNITRNKNVHIGYYDKDKILRIVPENYTRKRLDELGHFYYNKSIWADCKILVTGITENTIGQEFPGHELYLVSRSHYFKSMFEKIHLRQPDDNLEMIEDENGSLPRIRVNILNPEFSKFDKMLEWIYTGDSEKWLCSAFTPYNYKIIAENVRILGLSAAMSVCAQYRDHLTICRLQLSYKLREELKITNDESISAEQ